MNRIDSDLAVNSCIRGYAHGSGPGESYRLSSQILDWRTHSDLIMNLSATRQMSAIQFDRTVHQSLLPDWESLTIIRQALRRS